MKRVSLIPNNESRTVYAYVWSWGTCGGKYPVLGQRKGDMCRILARGKMNSALIEFLDGYRVVTSRNGLRRRLVRSPSGTWSKIR